MSHHTYSSASFKKYLLFSCGLFVFGATTDARDYYVNQSDPHARDFLTNGSEKVPFKTLAAASHVAYAGDTVHILPGVYREILVPVHSGTKDKPIVFQAEGENVWVKGSELVGDWTYESGYWVKRPWHPRYPYDAKSMDSASNAPFHCSARMEQVFVDGMPLQWYPEKKTLQSGGFWWAEDGTEIALMLPEGMDPNKCPVEIPVREAVVAAWPDTGSPMTVAEAIQNGNTLNGLGLPKIDWIVIRNFHFAHSIGLINRAGVRIQGEHWLLEGNVVERMNKIGIQADNFAIIKNNVTKFNGQSGYGAGNGETVGAIFDGNASLWDNAQRFSPGSCGGGLKCVVTRDFIVRNHLSLGAYGSGVWFDWRCRNTVIENCIILPNAGGIKGGSHGGIFIEFSDGVQIKNNIVLGNFKDSDNGPFGAGIVISSTSNVSASGNIVLFSQGGFGIVGGPIDKDHPFLSANVTVSNNLILGAYSFPFSFRLPSSFAAASNNDFRSNILVASSPGAKSVLDLRELPTLANTEAASNGTLTNNQEFADVESLSSEEKVVLSNAAKRIFATLARIGLFPAPLPEAVEVEKILKFPGCDSQGLLVSADAECIILVNNPSAANWQIALPSETKISVFFSATGIWQDVRVENGKILCAAPVGLTIVRGLASTFSHSNP